MESMMEECIANCIECEHVCLETITYCLEKGGAYADASHIRILMDCAEICRMSSSFMMRDSEFHMRTCLVCAEICAPCGESCEAFSDDPQLERCAEICLICAESCTNMGELIAA